MANPMNQPFTPKYIAFFFTSMIEFVCVMRVMKLDETGAEALFADVGHFSVLSIQISACCVVFPSIVLAYTGQAAYLRKHSLDTADAFYKSVPGLCIKNKHLLYILIHYYI